MLLLTAVQYISREDLRYRMFMRYGSQKPLISLEKFDPVKRDRSGQGIRKAGSRTEAGRDVTEGAKGQGQIGHGPDLINLAGTRRHHCTISIS